LILSITFFYIILDETVLSPEKKPTSEIIIEKYATLKNLNNKTEEDMQNFVDDVNKIIETDELMKLQQEAAAAMTTSNEDTLLTVDNTVVSSPVVSSNDETNIVLPTTTIAEETISPVVTTSSPVIDQKQKQAFSAMGRALRDRNLTLKKKKEIHAEKNHTSPKQSNDNLLEDSDDDEQAKNNKLKKLKRGAEASGAMENDECVMDEDLLQTIDAVVSKKNQTHISTPIINYGANDFRASLRAHINTVYVCEKIVEGSEFWIQKEMLLFLTSEMDLYNDKMKKLISIKEFLDFQTKFMLEVIEAEYNDFYAEIESQKQLMIYEETIVIKKCDEQLGMLNKFDRLNSTNRSKRLLNQIMKTISLIYLEHERSTQFLKSDGNKNIHLLMKTKNDLIGNCILKNFRFTPNSKKLLYDPIKNFFDKIYLTVIETRKDGIVTIIKEIMSDKNNKNFLVALRPFASRLNAHFDTTQFFRNNNSKVSNLSGTCTNAPQKKKKKNDHDLFAEVEEEKEKNDDMEFKNSLIKATFGTDDYNIKNFNLPNIKDILPEIENKNVKIIDDKTINNITDENKNLANNDNNNNNKIQIGKSNCKESSDPPENIDNTEDIDNLINDKYEVNNDINNNNDNNNINENINKINNNDNNNNINESANENINKINNDNKINEDLETFKEAFQANADVDEFFQEFQINKSKSKDFFDKMFSIISASNKKKKPSPQMQQELEEKNKRIQELQDENARLQARRKPSPQMQKELEEKNKRIQELQDELNEKNKRIHELQNSSSK
jgi:hypothetical protein